MPEYKEFNGDELLRLILKRLDAMHGTLKAIQTALIKES